MGVATPGKHSMELHAFRDIQTRKDHHILVKKNQHSLGVHSARTFITLTWRSGGALGGKNQHNMKLLGLQSVLPGSALCSQCLPLTCSKVPCTVLEVYWESFVKNQTYFEYSLREFDNFIFNGLNFCRLIPTAFCKLSGQENILVTTSCLHFT